MKIYSKNLFYVPASPFRVEQNPMKRKRKELRVLTELFTPVLIISSSPVPPGPY